MPRIPSPDRQLKRPGRRVDITCLLLLERTFGGLPIGAIHEWPLQLRRDPLVTSAYRRDLPVRSAYWRDLLVRSAVLRWIIQSRSAGTTSVPLRSFGGTCLSGPSFDVGPSIAFPRGLKSRAESGAKAPHSIWSAAIYRRSSVKALAFTTLALPAFWRGHESGPLVGAIHESPLPRARFRGRCKTPQTARR